MAQSGGVDVTKHVGKSAKGGGGASGASGEKEVLGSLGEVNSDIAGKVSASTGVDVGDVVIEEDPKLEEAGKSGVAKDAKTIAVKPGASDSTIVHELVHVVQMRGGLGVSGEGKTSDKEVSQVPEGSGKAVDVEAEANEGSKAILSGQKFDVKGKASGPLYEEDEDSSSSSVEAATRQAKLSASERTELPALKAAVRDKKRAEEAIKALNNEITDLKGESTVDEEAIAEKESEVTTLKNQIEVYKNTLAGSDTAKILAKDEIETDIESGTDGGVDEWFAGIVPDATFMGMRIGKSGGSQSAGVHRELLDRLLLAESHLKGLGYADAAAIGIRKIGGLRPPKMAVGGDHPSMHCYGMAIDVNYEANPFLMGDMSDESEGGDKEQILAIKDATDFVGHFDLTYSFLPVGYDLPENVGLMWDRLHNGSEDLKIYFALSQPGNRELLEELLPKYNKKRGEHLTVQDMLNKIESNLELLKNGHFRTHDSPENGFMDLNKDLVEALVTVGGLKWGAQYLSDRDIMHFDLRSGSIPR